MLSDEDSDDISRIKKAMRLSHARCNQQDNQSVINSANKEGLIAKLEAQLALKDQEIRYYKKKLSIIEKNFVVSQNHSDQKIRAIEKEYDRTLQECLRVFDNKYHAILSKLSQLPSLVENLERSSLHGRHFAPSESNLSLLMRMKEIANQICHEICQRNPDTISSLRVKSEHHVDMTLIDICNSLEDENSKLKRSLSILQDEIESLHIQASKSELIPQYRTTILKYKADTAVLEDNLRRLQVRNEELLDRLENFSLRFHSLETEKCRLLDDLNQMKHERDQYQKTMSKILHQSRNENLAPYQKDRVQVPDMNNHSNHSEEIVRRDLELLDDEIGDLRRQLELAAASKTQSLVKTAFGV